MRHNDPWALFKDEIVVLAGGAKPQGVARVLAAGPREVLVLARSPDAAPGRQPDGTYWARYVRSSAVGKNNATVALLAGGAAFALRKERFFRSFRYVGIATFGGWLAGLLGLLRYGMRGDLKPVGVLRLSGKLFGFPCILFENTRYGRAGDQRMFAPPDMSPKNVLRLIEPVDYVLLRWPDLVDRDMPMGDLDILVRDADLERLRELLTRRLGTFPVDAYSESGSGGHTFKSAPYYPPHVARRLLAAAAKRPSGVKALSGEAAYLSYAYHLLFHKTGRVPSGSEALSYGTWPSARSFDELIRLADDCGRRPPTSFSELEEDLKSAEMMPPLDTIGFYSKRNPFLQARYVNQRRKPGLAVFFVRDFGIADSSVAAIRRRIIGAGYDVKAEGAISQERHKGAIETIRGGNWYDKYRDGKSAPPIYYFVCHTDMPLRPSKRTRARYPLVDDERLMVKRAIRDEFTRQRGVTTNIVHASDNAAEACEYVKALGLEDVIADLSGGTSDGDAIASEPKNSRLQSTVQRAR